jgi:hypothetical protein
MNRRIANKVLRRWAFDGYPYSQRTVARALRRQPLESRWYWATADAWRRLSLQLNHAIGGYLSSFRGGQQWLTNP